MQENDLVARALAKDQAAIGELIEQQRQGKFLRLYPEGRKGPTDEGMAPIAFGNAPSGLIRFSFGREPVITLHPPLAGQLIVGMMHKTANLIAHYLKQGYTIDHIDSLATKGLDYRSAILPIADGITVMFNPLEERDFDLGVYHARRLVDQWITLILEDEEGDRLVDPKWGLTDQQVHDAIIFAPPPERE